MKFIFILTGGKGQFLSFCRSVGINPRDRRIIHVTHEEQLRGFRPEECIYFTYGTWYERPEREKKMFIYLKNLSDGFGGR